MGLLKTPALYGASELKASMKGLGVDEDSLTEIVCSRTNQELQEINRVYAEVYKTGREMGIVSNTFGDFHRSFIVCLTVFPSGSDGKESAYNAGDSSLIPGL